MNRFPRKNALVVLTCLFTLLQACSGGNASGETQASLPTSDSSLSISGNVYGTSAPTGDLNAAFLGAAAPLSVHDCPPTLAVCYPDMLTLIEVVIIPAACLNGVQNCVVVEKEAEEADELTEEDLNNAILALKGIQTDGNDGGFDVEIPRDVILNLDMFVGVLAEDGPMKFAFFGAEEEPEEIAMEEVDLDSTIAAENFENFVGAALSQYETLASSDFTGVELDHDSDCLLEMQEAQFEQVLQGGAGGVSSSLSILQLLTAAAIAEGTDFAAGQGYASLAELIDDLTDGDLGQSALEALSASAAAQFGGNAQAYAESYAFAVQDNRLLTGVYASSFATDSGDTDPCDTMETDPEVLTEAVSVALSFDDTQSFVATFGTDGAVTAFFDYMAQYSDGSGNFDFDGDEGVCSNCPAWNPAAVAGILNAYEEINGTFADFSTHIDTLETISAYLPQDTSGVFDYGDWATAMTSQYLGDPENFDVASSSGFWGAQIVSGLDFDDGTVAISTFDCDGIYQTMGTAHADTYSSCYLDPSSCVTTLGEATVEIAGITYQEYSTAAVCGDGTCDSGEGSSCYLDCSYSETVTTSSYYGSVCGNGTCEGYESYSCPSDCPAESGTAGTSDTDTGDTPDDTAATSGTTAASTYCGDGTCNGSETSSSCYSDCLSTSSDSTASTYTYCGDGTCNGSELSSSCPADCTSSGTSSSEPVCGDNVCNGYETIYICYVDCYSGYSGSSSSYCGDGTCNGYESYSTCSMDCH